jgi:hypothetical protein
MDIESHGETMLYVIGDAFRGSGVEGRVSIFNPRFTFNRSGPLSCLPTLKCQKTAVNGRNIGAFPFFGCNAKVSKSFAKDAALLYN